MPPRHQMMAPHWPTLACPLPAVDQVGGCDFVKAVPEDARAKIHEIVTGFKSVERFRSYKGKNPLLDGHTPNEQHRLKVRLTALYMTLERLRPKHSAIVELGTYVGTTAMGMRMVMDHLGYRYPRHILHVYDSWQGLPAPRDYEGDRSELKKGGLRSSVTDYLDRFRAAGLDPPYIHKGFFGEIPDSEFPEDIAFAFFDGDFYDSIHQSFNKSWRKMQPGGTVVVDDYLYPTLEGVRRCVDDFLADKPASRLPSPLNVSNLPRQAAHPIVDPLPGLRGGYQPGRQGVLNPCMHLPFDGGRARSSIRAGSREPRPARESSMRGGPPSMRGGPPREPRPRKRCAALLQFASEQLQGSPHTVIDAAALNTEPLLTGLAICVHNGTVFYRESHHKHAWHGSSDRSYGALQVANLWLARTGYRGTRCWQHSGRDDQRLATSARPCLNESRVRQPTGQCVPGLPAMLWHWCARDDSCRRPGSKAAASSYPGGLFLWPEWDYEGTITQHQPPTRLFRREMARLSPPWASRPDARLRYRGSLNMGPRSARAAVLHCGNESASGEAAAFFRERTDFGAISWEAVSSSRRGDGLPESMRLEANLRHKHVLWLPGGADWSSSLNRFMALGSTLYLPGDIGHSHSLNALMLLERCNGKCAITYNLSAGTEWRRPGTQFGHDVCTSIRRAFLSHDEAEAERYAAGLSSFVERELSPDCVDEYVLSILKALPQTVRRPELLGTQLGPGGGRVGFRPFRCANFVRSNSILKREVGALEHAREWHGCKL